MAPVRRFCIQFPNRDEFTDELQFDEDGNPKRSVPFKIRDGQVRRKFQHVGGGLRDFLAELVKGVKVAKKQKPCSPQRNSNGCNLRIGRKPKLTIPSVPFPYFFRVA